MYISPLWVPHRQSSDYDVETHNTLIDDGYTSECIVCYGMCQIGEDAYYDTEEDEGPICTGECFDRYFGRDKSVDYEWSWREKDRFTDKVNTIMRTQAIKLIKDSFSEDFMDKFELSIDLRMDIRLRSNENE